MMLMITHLPLMFKILQNIQCAAQVSYHNGKHFAPSLSGDNVRQRSLFSQVSSAPMQQLQYRRSVLPTAGTLHNYFFYIE